MSHITPSKKRKVGRWGTNNDKLRYLYSKNRIKGGKEPKSKFFEETIKWSPNQNHVVLNHREICVVH